MCVCKDVSVIMCHLRANPISSCQERGDTTVNTWFLSSVSIQMSNVWVNGRGVVACIDGEGY